MMRNENLELYRTAPLKSTLSGLLGDRTSRAAFNQIYAQLLASGLTKHFLVAAHFSERLAGVHFPSLSYAAVKHIRRLHHLHQRSPFLFNALITGYARGSAPRLALSVYNLMLRDGVSPDGYSFPLLLKSCMGFSGGREAPQVHSTIFKRGFSSELFVQNALVHLYGMCGELELANDLFEEMPLRDVVSWTSLISGFAKAERFCQALACFTAMDVDPNTATLSTVLFACGRMGELAMGSTVHGQVLKRGVAAAGNALMDMYVKCECLHEAKHVFDDLPHKDIISWTILITGLPPKDAIEAFHDMLATGLNPDKVLLSTVLSACANLGALDSGQWVHDYIVSMGMEWDVHLGTAMVDMYAKCGSLDKAIYIFHTLPQKNVPSWNAVLGGLALHGRGEHALQYYQHMVGNGNSNGLLPNDATFVTILSACSHAGLVEQGLLHFHSMAETYNHRPKIEHYGCMVDLLTRAGMLLEAFDLIRTMPMEPDVNIWGAILTACHSQRNFQLSQHILNHLLELNPSDSGVYVLLSNIFARGDKWRDVTKVRKLMRDKGIRKEPGSSIIELNGKPHEFLVGLCDHPQKTEIWFVLEILTKQVQLYWL